MRKNAQPQPPEDGLNPWRVSPGEGALGMGIFILLNQSQGGMCIYNTSVIGLGFSQKSFGL